MKIPFYKMQGAANDFIVINNIELSFSQAELVKFAQQICRPHFSLGSDALMVLDKPQSAGDLRMRFFNSDGSEAEMCGNGRSEEHTSELQSRFDLVCRLLLEKKNKRHWR